MRVRVRVRVRARVLTVCILLTSIGIASRVFQPPKAVPPHLRPVMNWKGRVLISLPGNQVIR